MATLFSRSVRLSALNGAIRARLMSSIPSWATVDPMTLSAANTGKGMNLVNGSWADSSESIGVIDPLNGDTILTMPNTPASELAPFIDSMQSCPKSGVHNPLKNVERYLMLGDVSARAGTLLLDDEVSEFVARLIQRVVPKSIAQCRGEVQITRQFLQNFSGDQVRFLARSFGVPGDHPGQQSNGHRWPFGPVALITPFNFPFEIPMLQLMGALFMGNKPTLHVDTKVAIVMEQVLRMLHACGLPKSDVDFLVTQGPVMNQFLLQGKPVTTQFTGSSTVAEKLAKELHGRIRVEDAGFDWKILGPDVDDEEYVAWVCDQDAYASIGQKCSAQSMLFMHTNWAQAGLEQRLKTLAARRNLQELTVGPVITVTTERIMEHIAQLTAIPGARVMFGGKPLTGHSIPAVYGAVEPTAVFVPLEEMLKPGNFELVSTEIFGPFQVVTEYSDEQLPLVLEACERMEHHLTAAVVSNDPLFSHTVLANTVNGTTYVGRRARTTGAPQNHWFGPAGDPRAAGLGTPESIRLVWSTHREIINDHGPISPTWTTPEAS